MKLETFIQQCLKNDEFRKYWEEDISNFKFQNFDKVETRESLTVEEALKLLEANSLDQIIDNKGIKATLELPTEIEFFEKKDGTCPVADFLRNINDQKLKEKTLLNIVNLSSKGNNARLPLSRYVGEGIYELRSKQSSNITRIFYFFVIGNKIILTNGYIKKSQEMDEGEFKKAKKYRDEYSRRK